MPNSHGGGGVETAAMTHEEAAISPVSRPSSRTELVSGSSNASESFLAPWFVCLRCVGACSLVCWACGRLRRLVLCCLFPLVDPVVWPRRPGPCPPISEFPPFSLLRPASVQSGLSVVVGFPRRGDDPRTDLQEGISLFVRFTWTWDRLMGVHFCMFPIVSFRVSFSARPLSDVAASQVPTVAAAAEFLYSLSSRCRSISRSTAHSGLVFQPWSPRVTTAAPVEVHSDVVHTLQVYVARLATRRMPVPSQSLL